MKQHLENNRRVKFGTSKFFIKWKDKMERVLLTFRLFAENTE